jgi:hypothetical protein
MSDHTRDVVSPIPASEVPEWIEGDRTMIFTGVVLATVVTYDASESRCQYMNMNALELSHLPPVCTLNKEVRGARPRSSTHLTTK